MIYSKKNLKNIKKSARNERNKTRVEKLKQKKFFLIETHIFIVFYSLFVHLQKKEN